MKTIASFAVLLALGVFTLAAVDAAGPPPAPPAAAEVDDVQDVVYLGKPHPAIVRLHLRIDRQSAFAAWDGYIAKLFNYLDRNKSGGLDRVEADKAPLPQQLQQFFAGNLFFFRQPGMRGTAFEQFDADRDGKVTLDELKAYYRKNGAGPVQIQAGFAFNRNADRGDTLFTVLDTNKDGKLSKQELLAAERVLMRYDTNDDELVSLQELGGAGDPFGWVVAQPQLELLGGGMGGARQSMLMLVPKDDSGRRRTAQLTLTREMVKRYDKDKDGKLTREEIGFPLAMFDRLDRNKDGKLDVLELLRWTMSKPAGEFTLRLGGRGGMMSAMRGPGARSAEENSVKLDGVRITVVPQSIGGQYGANPYLANLFQQIDTAKKGFVTRTQVAGQQYIYLRSLFDLADANNDGRLTTQELKDALAVLGAGRGRQLSLSLASTGQGLFQALDVNSDGRLSVREMRNAWARLADLDRDGDGCISRAEFPQQLRLTVSDGPNYGYAQAPTPVASAYGGGDQPGVRSGGGPLWFRKMDRNGDGDVSPSEWLGSKEDFDRIDTDKDRLISAREAEAFDARLRKK